MSEHARLEERIAAFALDEPVADDHDAQHELVDHLAGCASCQALYRDLRDVAGELALAVEPRPVPEALGERVMASIRGERQERATAPPRARAARALVAAALAVAAAVSGLSVKLAVDAGRARAEAHDAALVAGLLGDPGNSTTVLSPIDGTGTITIVVARDGRGALVGNGLAIPHGRVFELWAFRGEIPVPMTVFRPTDGRAIVAFTLGAVDPNQVRGFAITVERGRVETPTLPAAYSGTVTA